MFIEDVVPLSSKQSTMVTCVIWRAMQSVVGHANIVQPATGTRYDIATMADVWRAFKQYALCHIHNEFGLCVGLDCATSEIEYQVQR